MKGPNLWSQSTEDWRLRGQYLEGKKCLLIKINNNKKGIQHTWMRGSILSFKRNGIRWIASRGSEWHVIHRIMKEVSLRKDQKTDVNLGKRIMMPSTSIKRSAVEIARYCGHLLYFANYFTSDSPLPITPPTCLQPVTRQRFRGMWVWSKVNWWVPMNLQPWSWNRSTYGTYLGSWWVKTLMRLDRGDWPYE